MVLFSAVGVLMPPGERVFRNAINPGWCFFFPHKYRGLDLLVARKFAKRYEDPAEKESKLLSELKNVSCLPLLSLLLLADP
jgi:hypothetical protein